MTNEIPRVGARDIRINDMKQSEITDLNGTYCPHCGQGPLDGCTEISASPSTEPVTEKDKQMNGPEDGSPTICLYCAKVCLYRLVNQKLTLAVPSEEELKELQTEPDIWYTLTSIQKIIEEGHKLGTFPHAPKPRF